MNHGNISREFYCINQPNAPSDASEMSFRSGVTFSGSCGSLGNNTVAVHPDLGCGDTVFINTVDVKIVTDYCPGCAVAQLDNFTTNNVCSGIADLGNFKTIKIFP